MRRVSLLIVLGAVFFLQPAPAQAGTYIQSCIATLGSSCAMTVTTGHLIIGDSVSCGNRSTFNLTYFDSASNVYASINSTGTAAPTNVCAIARNVVHEQLFGTTTTSGSVTFSYSGTGNMLAGTMIYAEYSGVALPATQDPTGGSVNQCASCGTLTATSGNITTTFTADLLISTLATDASASVSGGYTLRNSATFLGPSSGTYVVYLADKNSGAPGTYAGTWTFPGGSASYGAVVGSFGSSAPPGGNAYIVKGNPGRFLRIPWDRPRRQILLEKA